MSKILVWSKAGEGRACMISAVVTGIILSVSAGLEVTNQFSTLGDLSLSGSRLL